MVRGADEEDGAQAGKSRGRDQRGGGALTRHPKAIRAATRRCVCMRVGEGGGVGQRGADDALRVQRLLRLLSARGPVGGRCQTDAAGKCTQGAGRGGHAVAGGVACVQYLAVQEDWD